MRRIYAWELECVSQTIFLLLLLTYHYKPCNYCSHVQLQRLDKNIFGAVTSKHIKTHLSLHFAIF